ncbi:MAG TPA: glycosyltransferase [Chitinophagaceae bacterium]|nr:glycosyltransferase [Chitinophagaceae bacterium]
MPLSIDLIVFFVFSFFVAIQLFYYLFFFSRLAFYKKKEERLMEPNFPVSIIVCAFNEEANLKKNLPLLLKQNYFKNNRPYFEVLVVNDNSEDDTFYLLNQLQEQYPHLHVVNLTQEAKLIPGKKFPLSMGIKSARFEHLLLTDADCLPAGNKWLSEMAINFSSTKKIVLGYSPYIKHEGWLNKKIRFETVHSAMQYLSYAMAKIPYMGVGRNLGYMREIFNNNKGFSSHHQIVSGDDDLFINQVANSSNTTITISPDSFTYSEPKKTEEEWHYQKKRHLSTGRYYKGKHKFLLGLYAFSHFAFWMSLIACIIFPHYVMYTAILFVTRWLIQWFIFQTNFTLLKEKDLINYIWIFDIWLLFYNLKSLPSIFIKTKIHWK